MIMNGRAMILAFLAVGCVPVAAIAQQHRNPVSAAEKEHILDGQFTIVTRTEGIPPNLKAAFSEITLEPSFALANPGKKYQVSDVVIDHNLPFRRLVFAGVKGDKWFIHYERGGRGHGYYLLVFELNPHDSAQFVWGGSGTNGATNLEQLRKMVATGKFSDEEKNYW